jgi:hypothetical protein
VIIISKWQPLLVVAGTEDELFIAGQFEPVTSRYTTAQVELVSDVSHMGVVVSERTHPVIKEWLETF